MSPRPGFEIGDRVYHYPTERSGIVVEVRTDRNNDSTNYVVQIRDSSQRELWRSIDTEPDRRKS